jgi:hypothetical protein
VKKIIVQKFRISGGQEAITTGGFLLSYVSLGMSRYQLPHYIFVVFPLAAIITAKFLFSLSTETKRQKFYKIMLHSHFIICSLLWLALISLLFFVFDTIPSYVPAMATLLFAVYLVMYVKKRTDKMILPAICLFTIMGVNLFLNSSFYPSLMRYQMGSLAGKWLCQQNIPSDKVFVYQYKEWRSFHFYAQGIIQHKDSTELFTPGDYIVTSADKVTSLDESGVIYDKIYEGKNYTVSQLSLKFLNPETREKSLDSFVILKIKS